MSFNPFGGMFDFNGDGKTDAFEMGLGFHLMDEMDRQSSRRSSGSSFSGFGDDDDGDDEEDDGPGSSFSSGMSGGHTYDEHDMDLDIAGISRFDLDLMDEDSRREALEEAGLDPEDFDLLY